MTAYVALLRAVNVGGTGKLPMSELKAMCVAEGFEKIQTYIASGNVVFSAGRSELEVKAALEKRLGDYAGKPVGVIVRTAKEMADVLDANPFPEAPPNWTVAIFLDAEPPADTLETLKGRKDEEIGLGQREIYVAYGAGMGRSNPKLPNHLSTETAGRRTIVRLPEANRWLSGKRGFTPTQAPSQFTDIPVLGEIEITEEQLSYYLEEAKRRNIPLNNYLIERLADNLTEKQDAKQ